MAKGQVEIVIVLGVVIVAIVAIIYAYQSGLFTPSDVPSSVKAKYDSVKSSFEALVRDGAQETMRKLSVHGGYLDNSSFELGYVKFLGKEVPYWQHNGQVRYPDVRQNFIKGIKEYISENKEGLLKTMNMKGVELGEPKISVNFLSNKIIVTVNMPTKIDEHTIPKPYSVEIQTRFAEVEEFSKGFVQYESSNRPLEYFTISSMVISPIEEGIHTVPVFVFLTECGEYVFKSWWDVKPAMEYVIKSTLANTYMPGKAPQNTMYLSSSPKYTLVPINGKRYESLDVSFHLPDDFELTQNDLQFSPDPISAISNIIPLVGECQSDPVYVNYYVSYPAVVRVKDPITSNVFQFAVEVFIKDNKPGVWSASGYGSDIQKQICFNPQCYADISVRDSSGKPIDYASVSFMGCNLGTTNEQGILRSAAPCGIGPLQVYRKGYEQYISMENSDSLNGISISIVKTPVVNLHFYEVIVQNLSINGRYDVSKDGIKVIGSDQMVYMNFYNNKDGKNYQRAFNSRGGQLSMMPAGNYMIGATLLSKDGLGELGGLLVNYMLSEDLDGKDLYVYIPNEIGYGQIADNVEKAGATVALTNVLIKCGLGPISTSEIRGFNGCSVGYNEV